MYNLDFETVETWNNVKDMIAQLNLQRSAQRRKTKMQ